MSDAPDFQVQNPRDQRDSAVPRFYMEAVHNQRRSEEDGVPRFDDIEKVEILIPGDRKTSWDGMVREEHRRRWPQQYAAFKAGAEPLTTGTPIKEMPGITQSQAQELAFQHIHSVETLASLTDDQAMKCVTMGGLALRDRAKRWLEVTSGDAVAEKLAAENRAKDARIEELEAKMADLLKRIDAMPVAAVPVTIAPPVVLPAPEA